MGKKHGKKELDVSSWTLAIGKCNLYCPPQPQWDSAILKLPPLVAYLTSFTASVPLLWSKFSSKDPQMLLPLLLLLLQTPNYYSSSQQHLYISFSFTPFWMRQWRMQQQRKGAAPSDHHQQPSLCSLSPGHWEPAQKCQGKNYGGNHLFLPQQGASWGCLLPLQLLIFQKSKLTISYSKMVWQMSPSLTVSQIPLLYARSSSIYSYQRSDLREDKFSNADVLHKSSNAPSSLLSSYSRCLIDKERKITVCISPWF